jgi:hypothetical protein
MKVGYAPPKKVGRAHIFMAFEKKAIKDVASIPHVVCGLSDDWG